MPGTNRKYLYLTAQNDSSIHYSSYFEIFELRLNSPDFVDIGEYSVKKNSKFV